MKTSVALLILALACVASAYKVPEPIRKTESGYVPAGLQDPIALVQAYSNGKQLSEQSEERFEKPDIDFGDIELPDVEVDGPLFPDRPERPEFELPDLPTLPTLPTLPDLPSVDDIGFLRCCWKDTYGRGVGKPIHACPPDQEKDAGLCYPKCRDGYKGVGPVCWEKCKEGYSDTGCCCTRWAKIISSDNSKCPWYDICGLTFAKGCSTCPDHDPPYKNDGCTCRIDVHTYAKHSYGRGVGKPMGCAQDEEYDAGLCYPYCREGFHGVGPVCWQHCPPSRPKNNPTSCCLPKARELSPGQLELEKAAVAMTAAAVELGYNRTEAELSFRHLMQNDRQARLTVLLCSHRIFNRD